MQQHTIKFYLITTARAEKLSYDTAGTNLKDELTRNRIPININYVFELNKKQKKKRCLDIFNCNTGKSNEQFFIVLSIRTFLQKTLSKTV